MGVGPAKTRWEFETPGGPVAVDEARAEDARALLALRFDVLSELQYFITEPHELTTTVEQMARLAEDLALSPNSVFLVAREGGRIQGYLTVQGGLLRRMRHAGKLEILVRPTERRRGVGRALMTACIDWAVANPHLVKLSLNVFTDNERAIALYERFGFRAEGRRIREYRMADGSWRDDLLLYRFVDGSERVHQPEPEVG